MSFFAALRMTGETTAFQKPTSERVEGLGPTCHVGMPLVGVRPHYDIKT